MEQMVCGFMFSEDKKKVALIRKNRPKWQSGRLNGIGGHIEGIEFTNQTMCREFFEETGVYSFEDDWEHFLTMKGKQTNEEKSDFQVSFFRCFSDNIFNCEAKTDENIEIHDVYNFICNKEVQCISNIKWLILLALDESPKFTNVIY